jgi:hypothetical protein
MSNLRKCLIGTLALVLLMITGTLVRAEGNTGEEIRNNLIMRKIGHQLLRTIGDSTSRIFPVQKISDTRYSLTFQKPFAFVPDSLARIVNQANIDDQIPVPYSIVVTESSNHSAIVYGFTSDDLKKGSIPCIGRALPKANYAITLLVTPAETGYKISQSSFSIFWILLALAIAFTGFYHLFRLYKKRPGNDFPVAVDNSFAAGVALGSYTFYPGKRMLTINHEYIALTTKELTLLNIFSKRINEVIDRNALLKEGWEDEGVITGRSLDVYVSKLRKKLQKDPFIKITNFHGRGYALEVEPFHQ